MTLLGLSIESLELSQRFEPQQPEYSATITTASASDTSVMTIKRRKTPDGVPWEYYALNVTVSENDAGISVHTDHIVGDTGTFTITWGAGGDEIADVGVVGTADILIRTYATVSQPSLYTLHVTRTLVEEPTEETPEDTTVDVDYAAGDPTDNP